MLANSSPLTPAPIMASFLGTDVRFSAVYVSIINSLSTFTVANELGIEPVAKTI